MIKVGQTLQERYNHTFTVVLPDYLLQNPVLKNEKMEVIVSKKLSEFDFYKRIDILFSKSLNGEPIEEFAVKLYTDICFYIMEDKELMQKLGKRKFDMMIHSSGPHSDCVNFIGYKFSVPFIHSGPYFEPVSLGVPYNPSVTPDYFLSLYGESMTFLQRIQNTVLYYLKPFLLSRMSFLVDLSTKYVPEEPYISKEDLRQQCQLTLCESDVLLDYPRPKMPNVEFVGGLSTSKPKPLNKDFQSLMDTATNGVVIVTFGSLFNHFPDEKLNALFVAMKRVSHLTFIMRYGKKNSVDKNIIKRPWLPQNDLLGHKNTKAFITHCGNSGQYEALYNGVPMIGVPIVGDQWYNAERMKNKNYGLYMPLIHLQTDAFADMILEVVNNTSYKNNINKASEVFRSRPETPTARASYWVDHVMKYGGQYMKNKGQSLPWYIYFGVDVYVFFFTVLAIICICVYKVFRLVISCTCRKYKVKIS